MGINHLLTTIVNDDDKPMILALPFLGRTATSVWSDPMLVQFFPL